MAQVVLLRGVNVGGHRTFRPKMLAEQLQHLGAVNIGAAGTFVIQRPVSRAQVRAEFARRLPFDAEIMVCHGRDFVKLLSQTCFAKSSCPAGHRSLRERPVPYAAIGTDAASQPSVQRRVAPAGPGARCAVRLRRLPTSHESHRLPRQIGPALWRADDDPELEYHHCHREGAGSEKRPPSRGRLTAPAHAAKPRRLARTCPLWARARPWRFVGWRRGDRRGARCSRSSR